MCLRKQKPKNEKYQSHICTREREGENKWLLSDASLVVMAKFSNKTPCTRLKNDDCIHGKHNTRPTAPQTHVTYGMLLRRVSVIKCKINVCVLDQIRSPLRTHLLRVSSPAWWVQAHQNSTQSAFLALCLDLNPMTPRLSPRIRSSKRLSRNLILERTGMEMDCIWSETHCSSSHAGHTYIIYDICMLFVNIF